MEKLEGKELLEYLKKSWGDNQSMIDYEIKEYYFYQLNGNLVLEFKKKPSIDKTIWYDDETEAPKLTEELFIKYNEMNMNDYATIEYKEVTKPYFIQKNLKNNQSACIKTNEYISDYESNLKWATNKGYFKRYATKEEIKEYNQVCEELKNEYIERLKKYFKRYKDKIFVSGYWVNR